MYKHELYHQVLVDECRQSEQLSTVSLVQRSSSYDIPLQASLNSEELTSDSKSLDFRVGLDALPDSRHQATLLRAILTDKGSMQSQTHQLQSFCVLLHTKLT
jgi:hypothetical protein